MKINPQLLHISKEVRAALISNQPVVAFESAVITHGLPHPINFELALEMENIAIKNGVTPATIALIDGVIRVGISKEELFELSKARELHKISKKDIAISTVNKWSGGTTVAATLLICRMAGIQVFATGGIGGVHRNSQFDISNDLKELAEVPVITVCSGAKSILDLPATIEYLETMGIPVLGYQTNEFPAFFSRESGLNVTLRVETPAEIADVFINQIRLGFQNALLITNPIPESQELQKSTIDGFILEALVDAQNESIHGAATTPYLLDKVSKKSSGKSLTANLALLKNNALLASQIAIELSSRAKKKEITI
ncbi:MAG: pseudouridine-5'-phosphate glycosidase [Anaerolineaceae bacterium]|nr:pseudouridine-5'-phosphate glycosidase [Anaerolineaceae bacterium]